MNSLRHTVATKILNNIPPRVKQIDFLMETLNISRESVYRRIRGDIPFAFEEIAKLSIELGFSVDELITKDMPSRIFFDLHHNCSKNYSEIFISIFQQYFRGILDTQNIRNIELTMIINHIPFEFIIFFNHLFKFSYYRWMHQSQESSLKYYYSDVILPDKLVYLQQKIIENTKMVQKNTIIFDPNIFQNLIQEIQYYYKRRLLNETDFMLLKEDLLKMVNMVESAAQTGYSSMNSHYNFYLSLLTIDSSSCFVKVNEQIVSHFFVNLIEPITISNPTLCNLHKRWLDSMRKHSTLITQSNEIEQVRYFGKQKKAIEMISNTTNGHAL